MRASLESFGDRTHSLRDGARVCSAVFATVLVDRDLKIDAERVDQTVAH